MKISILTLFPHMFEGVLTHSIIKRAREKKLVTIEYIDIRDFGIGKHKIVDDTPYGGGRGMLMRVDVIDKALTQAKSEKQKAKNKERIILLDPQGKTFTQKKAKELTKYDHIILICGRYEGVDERVRDLVDEEISIGDYVLTGGEIPAMIIIDSVIRLIPGVLKKHEATEDESFSLLSRVSLRETILLEHPQYTRPKEFEKKKVPMVLLSGNHKEIEIWKKMQALKITQAKRPDLLKIK